MQNSLPPTGIIYPHSPESMKNCLLSLKVALGFLLLCSGLANAQQNLIINGDFESRRNNQPPQGAGNIGPVDNYHPYDDLPNWIHTPYTGSNSPTFLATDGVANTTPYGTYGGANSTTYYDYYKINYGVNYSFSPHAGKGCVILAQHDVESDHRYDEMITQQLANPLQAGHRYQVGYWVLRSVSAQFRTELALSITDSAPSFDSHMNTMSPSPGNKVVLSGNIQDMYNWTYVTGFIDIPNSQTNNRWITIGYARTNQVYDANVPRFLPEPFNVSFITHIIDDISLVDIGCATRPEPSGYYYAGSKSGNLTTYQNVGQGQVSLFLNEPYNFTFTSNNPSVYLSSTSGRSTSFYLGPNSGVSITATATNAPCGMAASFVFISNSPYGYSYAPNPASGELTVTATNTSDASSAKQSSGTGEAAFTAELYDNHGRRVKSQRSTPGKATATIDVRDLPNGLYNLRIGEGKQAISEHIQITH
jgi:hypothetical protein